MIYFLTVHWKSEKWIPIQCEYIHEYTESPHQIWAELNQIDGEYRDYFDRTFDSDIKDHATKLNKLAKKVSRVASEDDLLVFIDGDAFPIRNWDEELIPKLDSNPLIAVQRLENNGDIQPHPCFCVTSVGFWNGINGDWRAGFKWKNDSGNMVSDVGGNLLEKLQERNVNWLPLTRTNTNNLHPLWFGVYGDLVYHHGAGFRVMASREDVKNSAKTKFPTLSKIYHSLKIPSGIKNKISGLIPGSSVRITQKAQKSEASIFEEIKKDKNFADQFIEDKAAT